MRHVLLAFSCAPLAVMAQSNAVPGLDVRTYEVVNAQVYGRRGPAFPNGEIGMNLGHSMCNGGTVALPWLGTSSGLMLSTYPKIASLLVRESGGRMVQVSGESHCKHSRTAFNFSGGPCAPCQSGTANTWRLGCSDTYSSGFSGLSSLGPTDEIDPWLGTWNPVGSYFDRGDPAVSGAAATDGIQSPITSSDPTYNRMIVPESELLVPGTFWGQVQLVVIGEPGTNRGDNLTSRQVLFSPSSGGMTSATTGAHFVAPVLTRWTGATTALGRNGLDDGHFMVGCKVTGPVGGFWHYEIAVHNIDNASGSAAVRFPVCTTARVRNAGFRDIDKNALNEWTYQRSGNEIAWLAPAGNPLDWNTLYNFWFDCDAAPVAGNVVIDRARIGPGALSVDVAAQVPGQLWNEYLGDGCGSPAPLFEAVGVPSIPGPGFALRMQAAPGSLGLIALSFGGDNTSLGGSCVRYIDPGLMLGNILVVADGAGVASWNLPVPAAFAVVDLFGQAAEFVPGGPVLSGLALSSGLRLRVGGIGCP